MSSASFEGSMEDYDEKEHDKSCALSSSPSSVSLSSDSKIVQPAETTGVDVDVLGGAQILGVGGGVSLECIRC